MTRICITAISVVLLCVILQVDCIGKQQPQLPPEITAEQAEAVLDAAKECTTKQLELSSLDGDWNLAFHNGNFLGAKSIQLKAKDANTLTFTVQLKGKTYGAHLVRPDPKNHGLLLNVVGLTKQLAESERSVFPVLVVDCVPDKYVAILHAGDGTPEMVDWAVYLRPGVSSLSESEMKRITDGLRCLQVTEELTNGEPLLKPVA